MSFIKWTKWKRRIWIMINIEKLSNEIEQKSYSKANYSSNNTWFYISIVFQILNIVICFFGIYLFLNKVITDFILKEYVIGILSFIVLSLWEKTKRDIIRKVNLNFLRASKIITQKQLGNITLMLFLIICNTLIAIQGGIELSDKKDVIEITTDSLITNKINIINDKYKQEINTIQTRIDYVYNNALDKKRRSRSLSEEEKSEINLWQNEVIKLKEEQNDKIKIIENKELNKSKDKTNNNSNTVLIFVFGSLIFETFIFIGISFCALYDYKSYYEITDSENYKKKLEFELLLELFFKNGNLKENQYCPSEKSFKDIVKIKNFNITDKNIKEFITILLHLEIIISKSNRRMFNKNYIDAKNVVNEYLK